MSKIYLVRHGQDEDNASGTLNGRRDNPLTKLGREQARIAGQKLKGNKIQVIYSSPLRRTMETADIIASELGLETVLILQGLIERDFGILTGKPVADIPKLASKILITDRVNYFLEVPGAETFPTLIERSRQVLEEIQSKHPKEKVLLVTHGDMGKMIRAVFHGWSWEEGLKTAYFDNTGVLELNPQIDTVE